MCTQDHFNDKFHALLYFAFCEAGISQTKQYTGSGIALLYKDNPVTESAHLIYLDH